jgi:hypothetical protein
MPSRDTDAALLAERRNGWEVRRETDEKSCRCSCGKGVVVEKVSSQQASWAPSSAPPTSPPFGPGSDVGRVAVGKCTHGPSGASSRW